MTDDVWRGNHVIYRVFDAEGRLIYIGRTRTLTTRVKEHRTSSWWWKPLAAKLRVQLMRDELAAKAAEKRAIQEERPAFNSMGYGNWADRPYWTEADHATYRRVRPMSREARA